MLARLLEDVSRAYSAVLTQPPTEGFSVRHAFGSLSHVLVALLAKQEHRHCLVVVPDSESYSRALDDLMEMTKVSDGVPVYSFPDEERSPFDEREVPMSVQAARQECLEKSRAASHCVVVTQIRSLFQKLPSFGDFERKHAQLREGRFFGFQTLTEMLVQFGYDRQDVVDSVGTFAVRGGMVDVYLYSHEQPIRVEFFGDDVESLRVFDVVTQRSQARISEVSIYPTARSAERCESTLCDYLPGARVIWMEPELIEAQAMRFWERCDEEAKHHPKEKEAEESRYIDWKTLQGQLRRGPYIEFCNLSRPTQPTVFDLQSRESDTLDGHVKRLRHCLSDHQRRGLRTMILCNNQGQVDRLNELLESEQMTAGIDYQIGTGELHSGFRADQAGLVVYTDHQIFGRPKRFRIHRRFKSAQALRYLKTLQLGDYVVHVDYGIGQYAGLHKVTQGDHIEECLKIVYQNGDKLFVPLEHFARVQKFSGEEGMEPKLNRLGTADWERLKTRTRKSIQDIAKDLIKLYAERKMKKGFAFARDTMMQYELEGSFEFEDTPDQSKVTAEIKADMESDEPMDRLICGDVGYGKTEVALRAAFKAVQDSKQVAVLVPTTILAEQHFETFSRRLKDFPVHVAALSRFQSAGEQKDILQRLAEGRLDVVIGTHRLLSTDVVFRDLGLLIIDEEQRFGVTHKEKLKRIQASVDTLTLTATPIPRTLHFSLMGGRDLSTIQTPPQDRLPIRTEIVRFDEELIYDALMKEIDRGGQVYFVHNRVQTIERIGEILARIAPRARYGIIHGQMPPQRIEKVVHEFMNRKFDVLLATTIIENGIDIPNVNTILIDQAQQYGVAQLYQLRGRVGRSSKQAYCYLITPPFQNLPTDALRRLQAIEEFTELGSGFLIAMRDLEIRGAGNLLGAEQSGFINAVGFELYCRLLEEAVQTAKHDLRIEVEPPEPQVLLETEIRVSDPTYFPDDYVNVPSERIRLYQELSTLRSVDRLTEIRRELEDRFGPLPVEAENLLKTVGLKIMASFYGLTKLHVDSQCLTMSFDDKFVKERELADVFQGKVQRVLAITHNVKFHQSGRQFELRVGFPGYNVQKQRLDSPVTVERLDWAWQFLSELSQSSESTLQLA